MPNGLDKDKDNLQPKNKENILNVYISLVKTKPQSIPSSTYT